MHDISFRYFAWFLIFPEQLLSSMIMTSLICAISLWIIQLWTSNKLKRHIKISKNQQLPVNNRLLQLTNCKSLSKTIHRGHKLMSLSMSMLTPSHHYYHQLTLHPSSLTASTIRKTKKLAIVTLIHCTRYEKGDRTLSPSAKGWFGPELESHHTGQDVSGSSNRQPLPR